MDELIAVLKTQIIEALDLEDTDPSEIDETAPLFGEGLGLDSIDALELVVMLEKHYDIRITEAEVGNQVFRSVTTIAEHIRQVQAERAAENT